MKHKQDEFYPEQWAIYQQIWHIGGMRHQLKEQHVIAQSAGASDFELNKMANQIQQYYAETRSLWRQIVELEPWFSRALEKAKTEGGYPDYSEWYRSAIEWCSHTVIRFRTTNGTEKKRFAIKRNPADSPPDDLQIEWFASNKSSVATGD